MTQEIRKVQFTIEPQPVLEGAGVRLKRSIATHKLDYLDPFLLFDHFGSDDPADYLAGFPMHPHRGIETVTYMLAGTVNHRDSLGNAGTIGPGDVQWMTAGGGIMHEEMPKPLNGKMAGFQLWVNLPARVKLSRPRYQEILSQRIPEVRCAGDVLVRVIAGAVKGVRGPVTEIVADPLYLDVTIPPGAAFSLPIERGHTAFAYLFEGAGYFGLPDDGAAMEQEAAMLVRTPKLVILGDGDLFQASAGSTPARFLLVSGKPLYEPIARYGPFVMNTREEIEQALRDLRNGTFVYHES
jgi:redox-sensitive bicupin YhaK (pirin superfamily)